MSSYRNMTKTCQVQAVTSGRQPEQAECRVQSRCALVERPEDIRLNLALRLLNSLTLISGELPWEI